MDEAGLEAGSEAVDAWESGDAGALAAEAANAKAVLKTDPFDWLALLSVARRQGFLDAIGARALRDLAGEWQAFAHAGRRPDGDDWRIWLMMAGRGFGKTRTGAEWINGLAARHADLRIALVAASVAEARAVMVEGESGILRTAVAGAEPEWLPGVGRLRWPSGAEAFLYSGANPERLRGPQHHVAWCDELAKWRHPKNTWDNLLLGMRLGDGPKLLVTTTPRPMPLLRAILTRKDAVVTGGATVDNPGLPPAYVDMMIDAYAGTRLGRQELDGELIEDAEGALWPRRMIEDARVDDVPAMTRVVVGVDPPAGSGPDSDACGIVVVGLGVDGCGYVLADASVAGARPEGWARAVAGAYARFAGDRIVAEKNQGGEMVEAVLRVADPMLPITLVHASRGKVARAEPVAALYETRRMFHAGVFAGLEAEMAGMTTGGGYQGPGRSPDRADALVWAVTELMLGRAKAAAGVRVL